MNQKESSSADSSSKKRVRVQGACEGCRSVHAFCDKNTPCKRCARLGIPCVQQQPKRLWKRTRLGDQATTPDVAVAAKTAESSASTTPSSSSATPSTVEQETPRADFNAGVFEFEVPLLQQPAASAAATASTSTTPVSSISQPSPSPDPLKDEELRKLRLEIQYANTMIQRLSRKLEVMAETEAEFFCGGSANTPPLVIVDGRMGIISMSEAFRSRLGYRIEDYSDEFMFVGKIVHEYETVAQAATVAWLQGSNPMLVHSVFRGAMGELVSAFCSPLPTMATPQFSLPYHITRHVFSFHDILIQVEQSLERKEGADGEVLRGPTQLYFGNIADTELQQHYFDSFIDFYKAMFGRFQADPERKIVQLFVNFDFADLSDDAAEQPHYRAIMRFIFLKLAKTLNLINFKLSSKWFKSLFLRRDNLAQPMPNRSLEALYLDLENDDAIGNESLVHALQNLKALQQLVVEHSGDETSEDGQRLKVETVVRLATHLPQLTTLGLVNFNDPLDVDRRIHRQMLQNIDLRNTQAVEHQLDRPDFSLLANSCPNMRYLSIANHPIIGKNLDQVFSRCALTHFNANWCMIADGDLVGIDSCPCQASLNTLTLKDNFVSTDTIQRIANCRALTSLSLNSLEGVADVTLAPLLVPEAIPKLGYLHIGNRNFLSPDGLFGLDRNVSLRTLHCLQQLHSESIGYLVDNRHLQVLILYSCHMSVEQIERLMGNMNLRELVLSRSELGDEHFNALWTKAPHSLSVLNVGTNLITGHGVLSALATNCNANTFVKELILDANNLALPPGESSTILRALASGTNLEIFSALYSQINNREMVDLQNYLNSQGKTKTSNDDGDWLAQLDDEPAADAAQEAPLKLKTLAITEGNAISASITKMFAQNFPHIELI